MDFSKLDLKNHQKLARAIIMEASKHDFDSRRDFEKFRNGIVKAEKGEIFHNLYFIKAYNDLLREGKISKNPSLLDLIRKRKVRTLSGVAPVTVLTKPFSCPGKCIYCPTDARMPKSYIPSQPAAQRAFRQGFNPYTQVFVRLKALQMTGHEVSKVELRVIGGTFNFYPRAYQTWFIKRCLQAMNEFFAQTDLMGDKNMADFVKNSPKSDEFRKNAGGEVFIPSVSKINLTLDAVIKENELSQIRCIGINVETRPDFISENELKRFRRLGITKVELGVQTTSDRVYKLIKRGHNCASVKKATRLLKDAGFKVGYHMMPNLPYSSPAYDKKMISEIFSDSSYRPDYLKIYPCVVLPMTGLYDLYLSGKFVSYSEEVLEDVLFENLLTVPEYCRVDRIARDIPSDELVCGLRKSNIRQILEERISKAQKRCREIRFREIKDETYDENSVRLNVLKYDASCGKDVFLSFEDSSRDKLIALLRLRFPSKTFMKELSGCAIIRDVHVYGEQIAVGGKSHCASQHIGWGSALLLEAEKMSRDSGFFRLAVIAGIGTREYYRKRGYKLFGTYMLKDL